MDSYIHNRPLNAPGQAVTVGGQRFAGKYLSWWAAGAHKLQNVGYACLLQFNPAYGEIVPMAWNPKGVTPAFSQSRFSISLIEGCRMEYGA